MGFLIKSVFWISLLLLIIPIGGTNTDSSSEEGRQSEQVGALQALFAVREAVGDLTNICERKPEVCATGKAALQTIGQRAHEAARLAQKFLEPAAPEGEPDPDPTGSIPADE